MVVLNGVFCSCTLENIYYVSRISLDVGLRIEHRMTVLILMKIGVAALH